MIKSNNKNSKKTIYVILLLILGISVGYAALSANLRINGTSTIKSARWSVHFGTEVNDIQVKEGSVTGSNVNTPASIKSGTNNTEIEFSVNLPAPGDYYEFTANVVNDGTLDAIIGGENAVQLDIVAHELEEENGEVVEGDLVPETSTNEKLGWSEYFTYEVVWDDTTPKRLPDVNDTLAAPVSPATRVARPVRVRVYYDKDKLDTDEDLPKKDIKLDLTFSINFIQDKNN
jgi:hypothetical protein